jgi:hypothetical protein
MRVTDDLIQAEAEPLVERIHAILRRGAEIMATYRALAEEQDQLLAEMRRLNARLKQLGLAPEAMRPGRRQ